MRRWAQTLWKETRREKSTRSHPANVSWPEKGITLVCLSNLSTKMSYTILLQGSIAENCWSVS
uniref:Uncharacterized protein n=1 Tax=Anguilla anguilla TaxID=7936 RepID=A0A0E9WAD3_ANGAN